MYIGKTKSIKRRFKEYSACVRSRNGVRKQAKIYNSISKYGWENHSFDILGKYPASLCNEAERFYIIYYNSYHYYNQKGMNLTLGGDGGSGFSKKMSEESKKKLSLSRGKGPFCVVKESDRSIVKGDLSSLCKVAIFIKKSNHVARQMYKNKKIIDGFIVKHQSEDLMAGDYFLPSNNKRPIVKLDLKYNLLCEYESIKSACLHNGIDNLSVIRRCASGGSKTSHGYIWMYKSDYIIRNIRYKPKSKHRYKVVRVSKIDGSKKTYNNILEASVDNKKTVRNINDCITKGYISGDYLYEYIR